MLSLLQTSSSSHGWLGGDRVSCAAESLRATTGGPTTGVTVLPCLVMTAATEPGDPGRDFLSAVALLRDLPEHMLVRGQVGAVVEPLDKATAHVEFSDDDGRPYAIVPCPGDALLVLRTTPLAA